MKLRKLKNIVLKNLFLAYLLAFLMLVTYMVIESKLACKNEVSDHKPAFKSQTMG